MSVKREFSISFAARIVQAVVHIGTTAVIARLLTPHELGVFAIAMGIVMVMEALRVFGVFAYLVRLPTLTRPVVRAALGLSLLMSLLLAAAVWGAARPLARFYGDAGVAVSLKILALNMLIAPWPGLQQALLQRARRFRALALVQTGGLSAGNAVSIALVLAGLSYAGLALGLVAQNLALLAAGLIARPPHFVWRPAFSGMRPLLAFGTGLTLAHIVQQIGARAGELVLGRVQTLSLAALYDKAGALTRMVGMYVSPALAQVLLPAFAAELKARERADAVYLARLAAVTGLIWPMLAFLGLFAHPLIAILYGDQWLAAAPAASVLAAAGMLFLPFAIAQTLLVALGRTGAVLVIHLVYQGLRVLFIMLLAPYGLLAVACGELAAAAAYCLVSQRFALKAVGLRAGALIRRLGPSLVVLAASVAAGALVLAVIGYQPRHNPFIAAAFGAAACGGGALAGLVLARHPLWAPIRERILAARGGPVPPVHRP